MMRSIFVRSGRTARLRALCASAIVSTACATAPVHAGEAYAAAPQRFVSLATDVANGREGPSRDHRIVWIYQKRGLPLRVVQEWQGWRKVEDPFGDQTWLLATMLQRQRTVYVVGDNGDDVALRDRPAIESRVRAEVARGVVAELKTCSRGWCEVKAGSVKGWMPRRTLWGAGSASTD